MASELGKAYIQIIPKAEGISSKISGLFSGGEASSGALSAGTSLGKKLIAGIAAAGIGTAVVGFVKDALDAGGALQQSFGGLDTIYGEAADAMKDLAKEAALAGISANTYAEQAVGFGAALKQAFGGEAKEAAEAANKAILDMADNSAKMGTEITSIQNAYQGFAKGNFTMLDNLKLGYGGTKEEMERLLKEAEKLTGVHYDIDNFGDIVEAIHVIQGELGLTGVAAEEAATTLTGSAAAMKASWENLLAALTTGEGLDEAVANLTTSFGAFSDNVLKMLGNLAKQFPAFIEGLGKIAIEKAPELIAGGAELIAKLLVGFLNGIPDFLATIPDLFNRTVEAFKQVDWASIGTSLVDGIIQGILNMVEALAQAALAAAANAWAQVKSFFSMNAINARVEASMEDGSIYLTGFASGGFPSAGQLFMARENGMPELIGRMGGKTAVANNDQIVAGITAGVADANDGVIAAIYAVGAMIAQKMQEGGQGGDWEGFVRSVTRTQSRQASAYGV